MKKPILQFASATLLGAILLVVPATSHAQDASTNSSSASTAASTRKFSGTVTAIDTNAMTFTVGTETYALTSESFLNKNGKPATLSEAVVGDDVHGTCTKGSDGKSDAAKVWFGKGTDKKSDSGKSASKKKKKKKAASAATPDSSTSVSTNLPPAAPAPSALPAAGQ
jgi:hypothetical protein